jgi:hypothetical protein
MQCPRCQYENLPDAVFCEHCGTKLGHICPRCQADNRVPSKFCRNCGTRLTCPSPAPRPNLLEKPPDAQASQPAQIAGPVIEQGIPEAERRQSMEIIHPRCCALRVRRRKIVACLCLYKADEQPHKEIRTFGTQMWELLVLSDWLVAQGVTHVAIARTGSHWPPVYRVLEHAVTVWLYTQVRDVEVMVDLLARGLMQGSSTAPQPLRALPHQHRRTLVAVVTVLVAALLTTYWVWRHPSPINAERPPMPPPSPTVQWQPRQISYQYAAGEPFVLALPTLERRPEGMPFEVTLEASGDEPSWLELDRAQLRIHGTAPLTAKDRTYQLIVRAHTDQGSDSRLLVLLTITGPSDRIPLPPQLPGHWTW